MGEWNADYELAQKCSKGDRAALDDLVYQFLPKISNRVQNLIPEWDAEDVVQDVVFAILNSIGSYRAKSALVTWIYRITTNKAADYFRKRGREILVSTRGGLSYGSADLRDEVDCLLLVDEVFSRVLVKNEKYLEVMQLKFYEGLSFGEISKRLGIGYEATRSRYRRAMDSVEQFMSH